MGHERTGLERPHRLELEPHRAGGDDAAHEPVHVAAPTHRIGAVGLETPDAVATRRLGVVHRCTAGAEQVACRQHLRCPPCDADAGGHRDLGVIELDRDRDRLEQASGQRLGPHRHRVRHEHHELVAGEPADGVVTACTEVDAVGDGDEHTVAGHVAVGLVDVAEVVEIDVEDG